MITDSAGKELSNGDLVIYATGTRSSALNFAVILDIKEDRNIEHRNANQWADARAFEHIKVRVKLERRSPDGTLEKEMHYPNGYDNGQVWTGRYKRTKTQLVDSETRWDKGNNIYSPNFGLPLKIERYFKVDNVTPEQ